MEELLEKGYFSFTKIENLDSIKLTGLNPKIGENSKADSENEKRFYFSKGIIGAYETLSRLFKYYEVEKGYTKEACMIQLEKDLEKRTYLNLKLIEGVHFSEEDNCDKPRRNLHSVPNVTLGTDKIEVYSCDDKNPINALEFWKYAYANYKDTCLKRENIQHIENKEVSRYIDMLNEFMERVVSEKDKNKQISVIQLSDIKSNEQDSKMPGDDRE